VIEGHDEVLDRRVLVLAPTLKDAELAQAILDRARIDSKCCRNLDEVVSEVERGAGAILLPEEAVVLDERERLTRWLVQQSPWSDLPVLVMAPWRRFLRRGAGHGPSGQRHRSSVRIRVSTLVSAIRTVRCAPASASTRPAK
jgi:hypothetical protein